jgi:acetyl esterase
MKSLGVCLLQLVLLLVFQQSISLAAECPPLRVGNPAGNYIVPGVRGEIIYRQLNGQALALDAYVQQGGAPRPAVVVIHGGAWTSGSRVAHIGQLLETLTRAGFNWFAVDYRLGGLARYAEALDDLRAALQFIHCHAVEFRIDPARIALLGEDAGAHLAALLAAERPVGVQAVALIGGFYDLREIESLKSQASNLQLAEASPITRLNDAQPATLVIHGAADREAPPQQARAYCEALRELGNPCDYHPVAGAIHRSENWLPAQWGYKDVLAQWLAQSLQLKPAAHVPYQTRLQKEIVFDARHGLKLDAYVPPGRGPFPAVIIAHGGGWEAGDKVTYVTPLFAPLARAGFAWFSIDYRLTPQFRHTDQLADLRAALDFVRANAQRFRVDPQRLALLGESASGQMVAQLSAAPDLRVAAVVSFYGVYDFEPMARELTPRSIPMRLFGITKLDDEARATLRRYSPLHNVRRQQPPLLLFCGTKDGLFTQHTAYAAALKRGGAHFEEFIIEGAGHGLENWEGQPEGLGYQQKLITWLKSTLTPAR